MNLSPFPLVAVDVGNNRTKFGWFDTVPPVGLPEPARDLQLENSGGFEPLGAWLEGLAPPRGWWIGSVNRPAAGRLIDRLRGLPSARMVLLSVGDLPLDVAVERPDMVGVDRLLDAVAANLLRRPSRPAVVVDVGTAITVDLVDHQGAFRGGAIAPGLGMSARALHEFTDLLPLVEAADLATPPPPLGTATVPAMQSGLFWGAVGLIRELVTRMGEGQPRSPQMFLTGGAGPAVADLLGPDAVHVPHLTLAGIALTAAHAPDSRMSQ